MPKTKAKTKTKTKTNTDSTGPSLKSFTPYVSKKSEESMNSTQKEHFKVILNKWKDELAEEASRTVHHLQEEANNFADPNDRASQEEEFSLELRTRDRERKLIKKIAEMLSRIDHDDYGYCDSYTSLQSVLLPGGERQFRCRKNHSSHNRRDQFG